MKRSGNGTANIAILLLLSMFALSCAYPFYYILIYSLSEPTKALQGVLLWPKGITLVNFQKLFGQQNIGQAFNVSLMRTIVGTILTLLACSLFAYGISKTFLPFRKIMYRIMLVTLYISPGLIPWYITMKEYGLQNNFLLYVLPGMVNAFFIILIKTYMEQLPQALEESAMVDGASYFVIFRKIVLPLSIPVLATIAIFNAVNQWNSWTDNLYLVSDPKLMTLQLMLYNFLNQQSGINILNSVNQGLNVVLTPTSIQMTITIIATLPIMLVYPFMQRYFLKGLLIGAVKG